MKMPVYLTFWYTKGCLRKRQLPLRPYIGKFTHYWMLFSANVSSHALWSQETCSQGDFSVLDFDCLRWWCHWLRCEDDLWLRDAHASMVRGDICQQQLSWKSSSRQNKGAQGQKFIGWGEIGQMIAKTGKKTHTFLPLVAGENRPEGFSFCMIL